MVRIGLRYSALEILRQSVCKFTFYLFLTFTYVKVGWRVWVGFGTSMHGTNWRGYDRYLAGSSSTPVYNMIHCRCTFLSERVNRVWHFTRHIIVHKTSLLKQSIALVPTTTNKKYQYWRQEFSFGGNNPWGLGDGSPQWSPGAKLR